MHVNGKFLELVRRNFDGCNSQPPSWPTWNCPGAPTGWTLGVASRTGLVETTWRNRKDKKNRKDAYYIGTQQKVIVL